MSINNNDTLIKETPESFLKNYVNDLSLFNVYKNHVDKLIVEASVKIKNNVHIYDRYVVCIMVNEVSFKKIYDFIDDLFKNGLIDPCHLSRARDFIDKYYLLNEGFVVGVDNGAYKIYSDMDDTAICLYMNKKDHYYKFYKKVKYIFPRSISLLKEYNLDLDFNFLPVRSAYHVSKTSLTTDNFEFGDKHQYGFHGKFYHRLFKHPIYWLSIDDSELTFYLRSHNWDWPSNKLTN